MDAALAVYKTSSIKSQVKYCTMRPTGNGFGSPGNYSSAINEIRDWMQEGNYQKVLTNRPLLYIFEDGGLSTTWTNVAGLKVALDDLRSIVQTAGMGNPYIVYSGTEADRIGMGADGLFDYALTNSPNVNLASYTALTSFAEGFWATRLASTAGRYIPTAMAGWDTRPRRQRPNPYQAYQPYVSVNRNYQRATPAEIVTHVQNGLTFVGANSAKCDADTLLCYAWNEHDEGGWLAPTRDGSGQARLAALSAIL